MDDTTPKATRYNTRSSIMSEYESAAEDSDSSMYFSMVEDSDSSTGKENAKGSDNKSLKLEMRSAKKATPLLRKVLNPTPRNKHNKRVSFSESPKPMPSGEKLSKIFPTTPRHSLKNLDFQSNIDVDSEVIKCQEKLATLMTIEEASGQENFCEATNAIKVDKLTAILETKSEAHLSHEKAEGAEHETMPSNQLLDCFATVSDGASDGGSDDREHSMLEDTIIEKFCDQNNAEIPHVPANELQIVPGKVKGQMFKSAITSVISSLTPNKIKSASAVIEECKNRIAAIPTKNPTESARSKLLIANRKSMLPNARRQTSVRRRSSTYEPRKVDARKTINIIKKARKNINKVGQENDDDAHPPQSRPSESSMSSGTVSTESKPEMAPPKGASANVRRPRYTIMGTSRPTLTISQRVQRRDTLMGAAAIPKKAMPVPKKLTESAMVNAAVTNVTVSTMAKVRAPMVTRMTYMVPPTSHISKKMPSTSTVTSPRIAPKWQTTNGTAPKSQAAKVVISADSRTETASVGQRPQRKTMAPHFPKPQINGNQSKFTVPAQPTLTLHSATQCTYCDKKFAKEHGLNIHLQDKCEKIPAAQRRLLMRPGNTARKLLPTVRQSHATDFISNNSRFFLNITNEAASGLHRSENEEAMTRGLNVLKANMKKMSQTYMGVTRTPHKSIKCYICHQAFLNCAEYASHVVEHQNAMQID